MEEIQLLTKKIKRKFLENKGNDDKYVPFNSVDLSPSVLWSKFLYQMVEWYLLKV